MDKYQKAVNIWQSWNIRTLADLERRLESFRILFAYNSGKIENDAVTYADTREVFENGKVCGFSGSPRTLFEVHNQKVCYDYLKEKIIQKEPITIELLLEVHRTLTSGTFDEHRYIDNGERPGQFKRHDYVTGIHEVGAFPEDVPQQVEELLQELKQSGHQNPLLAAAYFHAALENIHPFADGNGRVGRTMMNYWLMINNHPPLVVHEEHRRDYYAALQHYDETEDLAPLISFLQAETVQTWSRQMPELICNTPHHATKKTLDSICAEAAARAAEINGQRQASELTPQRQEPELK